MIPYTFTTKNHYIKYKLYDHLRLIDSTLFTEGYSFLTTFLLSASTFDIEYYNDRTMDRYDTTGSDPKGSLIKIIPSEPVYLSYINYFRKNTFVDVLYNPNSATTTQYKSLIVELVENEYFVIETPKANSGITNISAINTIYDLGSISDILYDIYINEDNDYYRKRDDSVRRNICNAYADFIGQDINIVNSVTALLTQDSKQKFILKIYDPENLYNGGVARLPTVYTTPIITSGDTYAILNGEVLDDGGSNITEKGFEYSQYSIPNNYMLIVSASTVGTGIGTYECNIINLIPLTLYYYRAYAINGQGYGYGYQSTFVTNNYSILFLVTHEATSISSLYMTLNGEVLSNGYSTIIERGFVYSSGNTIPDTGDTTVILYLPPDEIGPFYAKISGLTELTPYYYRAYATNDSGITYGEVKTGTTLNHQPPVINIDRCDLNMYLYDRFTAYGQIISDDGESISSYGFVYSSGNTMPDTGDTIKNHWTIPTFAPYSDNIIVELNKTYYVRAYCTNTYFTAYSSTVITITTGAPSP